MQLHELKSPKGSRKKKRIVGRGRGSGRGQTAGRGENGQRSRSGRWSVGASEGGQSRLMRRLPKFGFTNSTCVLNQVVNVSDLNRFANGSVVNAESLKEYGLISSLNKPFKILGKGEVKIAVTIQAQSISKSAQEKVKKAGGKIELIEKKVVVKHEKLHKPSVKE